MFDKLSPIESKSQLVAYMQHFCKPYENWKVGVEYEVFPYNKASGKPLRYQDQCNLSLQDIFTSFQNNGWQPLIINNNIMQLNKGEAYISFEAGGQLEFSSTPQKNIHDLYNELTAYAQHLNFIEREINISYLDVGFPPEWRQEEIPSMPDPTSRNLVIYNHLRKMGKHGLDIMFRTASTQVSVDFSSEADMVKKYRVSAALQPIISTLFANSSLVDGKPSGYSSYRRYTWMKAYPEKYRVLQAIFKNDFSFEKYVDFVLESPMIVIHKQGAHIEAKQRPFYEFLQGNLKVLPGKIPTFQDWDNHIATFWPEVRLKNVLELRGTDSGSINNVCSLAAIWVGLLYEQTSLNAALELVSGWDDTRRKCLYDELINKGLKAKINHSMTAKDLANEILNIAKQGLKARAKYTGENSDESHFLDNAYEISKR